MQNYEYYKSIFENKRFPLAFVDLDFLDKNITLLLQRAQNKNIRIASKSIRCRAVMDFILKKNNQFQGIMSFFGEEAVFLSQQGFDDILLGYPIVDEIQIEAIGKEIQQGKYLCLMVDHPQHLSMLEKVGKRLNITFPVCIDLDMSVDFGSIHFGVWRSPITNSQNLKVLLEKIQQTTHVRLDGLMGYEAQIAGVGDAVKGKAIMNGIIRFLKKQSIPKIAERRAQAIQLVHEMGFNLKFVNGGGTGSLESTTQEKGVTEVTVGSGFFHSHLFDHYSNFQLFPAAAFAVQVTRIPKEGMFTCHGGGYIASGGVEKIKAPLPYLPQGIQLDKNEGAGEVQTPLFYSGKEKIKMGDPIFFRHSKAGELCERFNELYFVRDGKIVEVVPTFRGEGKCFI